MKKGDLVVVKPEWVNDFHTQVKPFSAGVIEVVGAQFSGRGSVRVSFKGLQQYAYTDELVKVG